MRHTPIVPLAAIHLLLCFGCSSGETPGPATDVPSEEAEDDDFVERMRGLVSPVEFERFETGRGLVTNTERATPGLTLVMPLNSTRILLVDEAGETVHTWETGLAPGGWSYLQDDGTLWRSARADEDQSFRGGGIGGILQRIAPDGKVLWSYRFADEARCQHHDIELLPNGNVLLIAWERKAEGDAIARGRDPRGVGTAGLWADAVYELRPLPPDGAEIVWSWHAWDHLVQDVDPEKPHFGKPSEHPERIDVNIAFTPPIEIDEAERAARAERKRQMAALGYGGGTDGDEDEPDPNSDDGPPPHDWDKSGDWMHTNAVSYHPGLDLIVLSSPELGELLVIDHSTTPEEARGSKGGRHGKGGDILWRWGNPRGWDMGTKADQRLFYQHDPRWLDTAEGAPPRLTVFNNGGGRPDGTSFSEVLELELPYTAGAGFTRPDGEPFGPTEPVWSYSDPNTFHAAFISGAARLASGNTLICSGVVGRLFEVTPGGEVVWDYYSPHGGDVEPPDHAGKAPPFALFRVDRYARDHAGIVALGLE